MGRKIICERHIRLAHRQLRKIAQNSLILGRGIYILKQTNYERCFVKIVDSFAQHVFSSVEYAGVSPESLLQKNSLRCHILAKSV